RAIGVAEGAGAVLLVLCRLHTFGIAERVRVLDFDADLFLVGVGQTTTVLNVFGKRMKVDAARLEHTPQGHDAGDNLAVLVNTESANDVAQPRTAAVVATGGQFTRQRGHDVSNLRRRARDCARVR